MTRQDIENLYREYGPSVFRRAMNILRNQDDAREAMQEVFITALTKGESFKGKSSAMTWLYSVTTHHCLNHLRNSKRRAELVADFDPREWTMDRPHPELLQIVQSLLRVVPQELAEVAVYYYLDDLTHDEISKLLGCSRRKVGYLLEKFRAAIEQEEVRHA